MSTQEGALTPYTLSGQVISPSAVIDSLVVPTHEFVNVIRDLVTRAIYHTESERHSALDKLDRFEKVFLKDNHKYAVTEGDLAGREDVSKRAAPQVGYIPPVNVPQIDYAQLARAIIQAQAQADAERNSIPE